MSEDSGDIRTAGTEGSEYQRDFSEIHPKTMFDELGRLQKARKTVAVILDALHKAGVQPGDRAPGLQEIDIRRGSPTTRIARRYDRIEQ